MYSTYSTQVCISYDEDILHTVLKCALSYDEDILDVGYVFYIQYSVHISYDEDILDVGYVFYIQYSSVHSLMMNISWM